MTIPSSQNKCKRKELYLLIDQITAGIPVANSTPSALFFHKRSTTLQNDKDAHRLTFLGQVQQTHNILYLFSIACIILMISEMTSASW